ncbi:MAG: TonB-dependent receptor [Flavobacteriaceae bacterium]|nr:TonB-dependent receptor [Flavobacteriaceae bacterium]
MKYFLGLLLFFLVTTAFSQNKSFTLSGTLISAEDQQPLESATIYLERIKDSTLVTYTISDKKGKFYIEDKTTDESLRLFVSYVGFQTIQQNVSIDKAEIDLGTIEMTKGEALDEVFIKSRAPITIKKDTLEFNVKSFKTRKDATVEDLLKKLPGVEVDEDGKITVNGKEVNKILVNGKPFFGDDPTIATRNLTKEIIEKVQVTDTKTDAEAFAGESSDGENKTINLTISEENNKGIFGRIAGGVGTDERYEAAGFFNRFDNDQRFSVLLGGNNINSPGFSFGEIRKMFGGGRSIWRNSNGGFGIDGRQFGGGQGIVTSRIGGANFTDTFGEHLDISADYFYSGSDSKDESISERENILPDARYFTNTNSESVSETNSHAANVRFNIKVDSTFLINIVPSFRFSDGDMRSSRDEISLDENNVITNQGITDNMISTERKNFTNNLDVTKRFGNRGSFVKFSMTNEFDTSTTDTFLTSETQIFGDNPETIGRDQFTDGELKLNSFFTQVTYRYPLISKKLFLDARFSHRDDTRESIESTFDFDEATQAYSNFNADLSTNFSYTNQRTTPSLSLNFSDDNFSFNFRTGYVFRTLSNEDALRPETTFKQKFEALEVNAYGNYRFSPKSSIYANYSLSNAPPDVSQLQPFQDVSNPLNIITGNPNLEPTNSHQMFVGYNAFDFQKGTGFSSHAGFNVSNNQVVSKTTVDENFVRNTTYANVDGNYGIWGSVFYSKSIKVDTMRTIKYRAGLSFNSNRSVNFNNDEQYDSNVNSISPNIRLTFTWKDVLEFIPNYRLSFTKNTYDLDLFEDQDFMSHRVGLQTATFLPKKWEWRNDVNFNYNPNVAPGFQRSAWFWNTTLAYSILKDQGTLTLKVYDLLNQNTNASRSATQNYIQDSQSLVLQRYAMLSFSWKFNSLGKKGEVGKDRMFYYHLMLYVLKS